MEISELILDELRSISAKLDLLVSQSNRLAFGPDETRWQKRKRIILARIAKEGAVGISPGHLQSKCKPYRNLSEAERFAMIEELMQGGLIFRRGSALVAVSDQQGGAE